MNNFNVSLCVSLSVLCVLCGESSANPPTASYIFPAGAQRGTKVDVRVGGLFLHDKPAFEITGPGVKASPYLTPMKRLWFEGPLIPIPESQAQEDYPADYRGSVTLAKDAPLGPRRVRVFAAQGGAAGPFFVVGDLPEVVEREIDGDPIPQPIKLPVTANGRIFPREDVDLWEFDAEAGKTVTAFVHAQSLNSPLIPRLEILDATGSVVAEPMIHPCLGTDGSVKFTPKTSGKYRVRISDVRAQGGPAYVYRLTVTTANVPGFFFPINAKADGLVDVTEPTDRVGTPIAINGRITLTGEANEWKVSFKKGEEYVFDLLARRAESSLCGVVTLRDAAGKELARMEASESADPTAMSFKPPADGTYTVRVTEKFRGRAGPSFVYRLRIFDAHPSGEPGFRLTVPADVITIMRGENLKLKLTASRFGGFSGPIVVAANLPAGVNAKGLVIAANQSSGELILTADATAAIRSHAFRVKATGVAGWRRFLPGSAVHPGTRDLPDTNDLRIAVAMPTPFKIIDQYVMTSAPRGETYHRKYKIDRGGFSGPIQIQLAEKQARHLQGVTGPVLTLRPGETEFEYPAFLPPWMEMGRTCRVCIMATAKVRDPVDGREHTVSFSSVDPNQQMIVVVGPGRLDLALEKTSIRAEGTVRVAFKIARSKSLTGAATVEAVFPEHWKGVAAAPLTIAADADSGELVLSFAKDCGPFNAPLVIRATVPTKRTPVTAEAKVELAR